MVYQGFRDLLENYAFFFFYTIYQLNCISQVNVPFYFGLNEKKNMFKACERQ